MFKSYITLAVRNIVRDKLFAFINLAGLAISLAAFILIALYIDDETSFEEWITDHDRIYRVEATFISPGRDPRRVAAIMAPARQALELEFGDSLEVSTRYYNFVQSVQFGETVFSEPFAFVDPSFLEARLVVDIQSDEPVGSGADRQPRGLAGFRLPDAAMAGRLRAPYRHEPDLVPGRRAGGHGDRLDHRRGSCFPGRPGQAGNRFEIRVEDKFRNDPQRARVEDRS